VNNAGVETVGSVEETPLADFRSIMETNYFGVIRCVQAVVKSMRERKSGCIINISSVAGRITAPPFAAYCASKWALEAMTEALAGEMKTFGVRVALVEPGIIDTAMAQRISKTGESSVYRQTARYASMFSGALKEERPPSIVAGKILEVAESGMWTLRHIVGPGAADLVALYNGMTDEENVDWNASDDATYFAKFG
jgi:NAD(P)-dependent dehydrogenase (short-subunit alcohol dehydrogenase family)